MRERIIKLWHKWFPATVTRKSYDEMMFDWENREAACCPEDVGFDEYIPFLKRRIGELVTPCLETDGCFMQHGHAKPCREQNGRAFETNKRKRRALAKQQATAETPETVCQ